MQEADKLELAAVIPVPCADTVTTLLFATLQAAPASAGFRKAVPA